MALKVMVVDDTIFYRKIIKDILNSLPDIEVVGTVNSGLLAINRIPDLRPDVITLDVEMPGMNGLQVLEMIREKKIDVTCIMVSSKTQEGSEATVKALELGAFDFVAKPDDDTTTGNVEFLTNALGKILGLISRQQNFKRKLNQLPSRLSEPEKVSGSVPLINRPFDRTEKSAAVAIGISTGGPNALAQVLPELPADINVPIFLVQHMPPLFSASLAKSLDKKCRLTVKEAVDGEKILPNTVYLAEGGKQMKVASGPGLSKMIRITDDPPENNCKPAADYLFRSVAREYGSKSTCVIMTGMGNDGKLGVSVNRAAGGFIIAQNAETSVVYGMPKAIVDAGLADIVAPLDNIAEEIMKTLR
ncbi:MAG: chemotaxis response regulator protein-glutamate methylesterase [Proteobacteria bacterium]|nr:chemotaxis response regulator protein-glutamate methylesterase [Pseudomonadota bacterium]